MDFCFPQTTFLLSNSMHAKKARDAHTRKWLVSFFNVYTLHQLVGIVQMAASARRLQTLRYTPRLKWKMSGKASANKLERLVVHLGFLSDKTMFLWVMLVKRQYCWLMDACEYCAVCVYVHERGWTTPWENVYIIAQLLPILSWWLIMKLQWRKIWNSTRIIPVIYPIYITADHFGNHAAVYWEFFLTVFIHIHNIWKSDSWVLLLHC